VLLSLIESGLSRDEAYRIVQRHAMDAWDGKGHLRDLLADDPEIGIDRDRIEASFSLERVSETSGVVFDRLAELTL
jgi:adenylosuccinate lyase